MNRIRLWIIAALAAALTLSIIGVASAQPTPPSLFTGNVTNADGSAASAGLSVEAYVGDTNCTQSPAVTTTENGATKYFVAVENSSTKAGCGGSDSVVNFRVGGQGTTPANNDRGGFVRLNLTLADDSAVTIYVSVWRLQADPTRLFISTNPTGDPSDWTTHSGQLVMTEYIGRNRWDRSDPKPVEVELE